MIIVSFSSRFQRPEHDRPTPGGARSQRRVQPLSDDDVYGSTPAPPTTSSTTSGYLWEDQDPEDDFDPGVGSEAIHEGAHAKLTAVNLQVTNF